MQQVPFPTSSESPRDFWPRLLRAIGLLVVAGAAHAWVDEASRRPSPALDALAAASSAPPTLVPSSERAVRRPVRRVTIITEDHVVPLRGGAVTAPEQLQAWSEPGAVGTTGHLTAGKVAPPPAAEPTPIEMVQPATERVAADPPLEEVADTFQPVGMPLAEVSRLPAGPARPDRTPIVEPDQRQLVWDILQRYASAFERLDVEEAKAVWPTVDGKALGRAFSQLQAQRVMFESCGITIAGSGANARCRGHATYLPRVGSRALHAPSREWTFQLARAREGWQIVDATVR